MDFNCSRRAALTYTVRPALGAALIVALLLPSLAVAAEPARAWAEGRILVAPRSGLSERNLGRLAARAEALGMQRIGRLKARLLRVRPGQEQRILARLRRDPDVAFAELDMLVPPAAVNPNDPNFNAAWHLARTGHPAAWALSTGQGVTVAVLDTGVDATHPDLGANVVSGWNIVSNNDDTTDVRGHGTEVAGIIAAITDNNLGVASVAYGARIVPVRVSNRADGFAYWSDIAKGIDWANDHGARVVNVSYAAADSSTIPAAAARLRAQGGVVIMSSGNTGGDAGLSPVPEILIVGGTTSADARAWFSTYGGHIDLAAPGASIWTTTRFGNYGAPSGTSYSAAVVSAIAAQLFSVNPGLTATEIDTILTTTAVDLGAPGWDSSYGAGRVDAAAAVASATPALEVEEPAEPIAVPTVGWPWLVALATVLTMGGVRSPRLRDLDAI